MNCPHCATTTETNRDARDFACPACGLAGPREVLEALAGEPIRTLDSAETLLRAAGVYTITLRVRNKATLRGDKLRLVLSEGRTLANAYAMLVEARRG